MPELPFGRSSGNRGREFTVVSGIAGVAIRDGWGFIIGDGHLNYAPKIVTESYDRINLKNDSL